MQYQTPHPQPLSPSTGERESGSPDADNVDAVKITCFATSYAVALGLELWHQFRPRPVLRLIGIALRRRRPAGPDDLPRRRTSRPRLAVGWMLFLAWILAIFYLYGTIHHARLAWGVFVLPLVLGLVGWHGVFRPATRGQGHATTASGGRSTASCCCWPRSACASASSPA